MTTRELREGCGPFVAWSESINYLKSLIVILLTFFCQKYQIA